MSPENPMTRREFVAGTSGLLLAGAAQGASDTSPAPQQGSQLAIHGGPKSVTAPLPAARRWGEPERQQLAAMLEQNSLFYWQGPQTRLLTQRFQEFCPLKYVQTCSSGTAAIHIAVAAVLFGLDVSAHALLRTQGGC